jgi:hypothetical protein
MQGGDPTIGGVLPIIHKAGLARTKLISVLETPRGSRHNGEHTGLTTLI